MRSRSLATSIMLGAISIFAGGCGGSVNPGAGDDLDAAADGSSTTDSSLAPDAPVVVDSTPTDTSITPSETGDSIVVDSVVTDTTPAVDGGPSADAACSALGEAYCAKLGDCAKVLVDVIWGDVVACRARLKAACLTTLSSSGVHETPAMTSSCARDLGAASCASVLAKDVVASCVPAPGDVVDGKACGDDEQCKSGFCATPAGSICGTCAPQPKPGDSCVSGQCGRALECVSGSCRKPGKLGEACDKTSQPCEAGLSCFSGKCVAGGKAGASCDTNESTAPSCDGTAGVFCSPTHVCQTLKEGRPGDACGYDVASGSFTICTAAATCRTGAGGLTGTCIAAAADGAACNADGKTGPGCTSPAKCVAGVCKLPDPSSCK